MLPFLSLPWLASRRPPLSFIRSLLWIFRPVHPLGPLSHLLHKFLAWSWFASSNSLSSHSDNLTCGDHSHDNAVVLSFALSKLLTYGKLFFFRNAVCHHSCFPPRLVCVLSSRFCIVTRAFVVQVLDD